MASGSEPVDVRADRAVQTAVAVATLAGFVFRQPWVIPVLAVVVGAGAMFGPVGNPIYRIFAGLVAPRLSPAVNREPVATMRAQDVLGAALLGAATVCLLVGLGGLAWIVTLVEAGVAAVAATTGAHLGVALRDRFRRR
ncbi:MAG TPA: DUF4395 family protein [Acidimicrobiia bacterium]|nr:DUF4395 family protein [Acidimicrobiia bacterium]